MIYVTLSYHSSNVIVVGRYECGKKSGRGTWYASPEKRGVTGISSAC